MYGYPCPLGPLASDPPDPLTTRSRTFSYPELRSGSDDLDQSPDPRPDLDPDPNPGPDPDPDNPDICMDQDPTAVTVKISYRRLLLGLK